MRVMVGSGISRLGSYQLGHGLDASINSIRMFRNSCGNAVMIGSQDHPDAMKWARMPAGVSACRDALSRTTSDTQSLWAAAILRTVCVPEAGATRTAFRPIR